MWGPNKTPGNLTEYYKSNNKIIKFPVKKFDSIKIKNSGQNSEKFILKEKKTIFR